MKTILTVTQAAEILGMSARRVRDICAANDIGKMISSRLRLLQPSDLSKVKKARRPVGNPNFIKKSKVRRKRETK